MSHTSPTVARTIEIAAQPDAVYALITDLPTLSALAAETESMSWQRGDRATPGAVFIGSNAHAKKTWTTRCTVTDAVPGRMFAFEVDLPFPGSRIARWQYDITPTPAGCRVTESTWDRRSRAFALVGQLATGVKDRTGASREHIAATLANLKKRAEA